MKNLSSSNRILVWIGAVIGVAIIVSLVLGPGQVTEFGAATPEGVVQRYIDAALEGDEEQANRYMTADLAASCEDGFGFFRDTDDIRVALDSSDVDGDSATVFVTVSEGNVSAFDSYAYTHDERYDLVRVDGAWKIERQAWPRYNC